MAERLRKRVESQPFVFVEADGGICELKITISLGVAGMPADCDDERSLVAAADKALYEAKKRRRNCTVAYSELQTRVPNV